MVAAAFFDVDRTLLQGSSTLALFPALRRAGLLPTSVVLRYLARQVIFSRRGASNEELEASLREAGSLIQGVDAKRLSDLADTALEQYVFPRVFPAAKRLIQEHKSKGDLVFLVSSAPREIVEPLARLLGADGVAATDAEIVDGKYTGKILRFCHGQGKADAVADLASRYLIDLTMSSAYGDSLSDLPMLRLVGYPVAVNPDHRLKAIALAESWPILTMQLIKSSQLRRIGAKVRDITLRSKPGKSLSAVDQ